MGLDMNQHAPRRARAIALPFPTIPAEKLLALIHALLAFLAPLLFLALVSCEEEEHKVDYGPEIAWDPIAKALAESIHDTQIERTQPGAFVHFETVHTIAAGQARILSADTGQTVINRVETDKTLTFQIVEKIYTYKQEGTTETLKREFELTFAKEAALEASALASARKAIGEAQAMARAHAAKTGVSITADGPRQSFHRLRAWQGRGPAPRGVRNRPGCLGIPNCEIAYRYVTFDLVTWDRPGGDLTRIEFVFSPDIPQTSGYRMSPIFNYLPGMFKACITQMVAPAESENRTLVTECREVVDYTHEAPTPTPSPTP